MAKNWMSSINVIMASALSALILSGMTVTAAPAQDNDQTQTRTRDQVRDTQADPQGDMLRERIRDRIQNEDGLKEQDRERLRKHLGECDELGLGDEDVAALFDESTPLKKQIRTQERVLEMAREGLPHEPVMQKLREGRRKGVNDETLDRVCDQMEAHVRTAARVMERAREDGVTPGDDDVERRRTREMAMHMWRGLDEEDMDQLRERARLRLRDGSCTTEDLAAASETAAKLKEMGVERERAVKLSGDALQNGYTAREMRQIGWMVMTAHMHGGPQDDVCNELERGIRNQRQLGEMMQNMWQHGWMGPADQHDGRGGHNPMDNGTGGGPGGQGQGSGEKGKGGGSGEGGQGNG
jgi:hypothetical protein